MKPKTTGLGKGLNAIFEIEELNIPKAARRDSSVSELPIGQVMPNPHQPRTSFDEQALGELAQSIRRMGVIQPITVRREGEDKYLIISGERRYRASQAAGMETIPAYVREANDEQLLEMALVENIQREDLNPIEIALSLQRLVEECNLTQESLAERVGKKRSTVANYIRLLKLPVQIQGALSSDLIGMGHARALLSLTDVRKQIALAGRIIQKGLSVRQVEEAVKAKKTAPASKETAPEREFPPVYAKLVEQLEPFVGRDISIKKNAQGGGRITISFTSDAHVAQMVKKLTKTR